MKKRSTKRLIVILLVVLALVLLVPWPQRINTELPAVRVTERGEGSAVIVSLDAWRLRYLVRDDQMRGEMTIHDGESGEGSAKTYAFTNLSYPVNAKGEFYYTALQLQEPPQRGQWIFMSLAPDLDHLLIEFSNDTVVAGSPERSLSAEAVWEYFEWYGTLWNR